MIWRIAGFVSVPQGCGATANSPEIVGMKRACEAGPDARKYSALRSARARELFFCAICCFGDGPGPAYALEEVEPEDAIMRRFSKQAMSLGH